MYKRIFYPDNIIGATPEKYGLPFEPVHFNSEDGQPLTGWFLPAYTVDNPMDAKGTVIHMHSNSGNIAGHWQFAGWLPDQGFNVLVFDYRGFGKSFGTPEPKGIMEDAVAAISYLRTRTDIDTSKIFIFGQSLGGSLAIASATINPEGVRAVAIESPFYSYSTMVDDRRPGEGFDFEPDDAYCGAAYVSKLSAPLLIIHGTRDSVMPHEYSEQLFAEANGPKHLELIPQGRHLAAMTERYGDRYQKQIVAFFEDALK